MLNLEQGVLRLVGAVEWILVRVVLKSDIQNTNNSTEKKCVRLKSNINVLFWVAIFILNLENYWNKIGVHV